MTGVQTCALPISGDTIYDGTGGYDYTVLYDSTGGSGSFSGTYTAQDDGILTYPESDAVGIFSEDGTVVAYTDTAPAGLDDDIYLGMSIEESSGMTAADVTGSYIICQIRRKDGEKLKTARLEFTFDGVSSFTGTVLSDSDGTSPGDVTGDYLVSDDGSLEVNLSNPVKSFQGQVSADGKTILALDDDADNEIVMMAGVKKTSGASNSLFNGQYQTNVFGGDSDSQSTTRLNSTADGAGNVTSTVIADSGGGEGTTYEATYTISIDGTTQIEPGPGSGIISSDGSILILVDTDDSDDDLQMSISIKKH